MPHKNKLLLIDLSNYENLSEKKIRSINLFNFPVGLMSLATFLKKNKAPLDTDIVNYGIDYENDEELIKIIKQRLPNFVGIRALSTNEKVLVYIVDKIKKLFPNIFIIIGGPYVSNINDENLKKISADVFVIGEGEETTLELFGKLVKNQDYSSIEGIAFRKEGRSVINRSREFIQDFNKVPFPDYDLINFSEYFLKANWGYTASRYALIESSRGCPYNCIYCHKNFGRVTRLRSAEVIFNEIKRLNKQYGMTDFFFVDDIFNINYQRASDIFDNIINSELNVRLHFPNGLRGDILDKSLIDKMIKAGTISAALAVETPSPRLQKYINKNVNLPKLEENIDYMCDKGVMVRLFFMYGFPTETKEEVEYTLSYMKKFKKCVLPYLFAAKYYKNTKMYSLAVEEGFSKKELEESQEGLYNEIQFCETPLLPRSFLRAAHYKWIKEIILNQERMLNAIAIQRKYHTEKEIEFFYSSFFGKKIENIDKLIDLCN